MFRLLLHGVGLKKLAVCIKKERFNQQEETFTYNKAFNCKESNISLECGRLWLYHGSG
jgi:hypothetical protein